MTITRKPFRTFEDVALWQKAHARVLEIYRLTDEFPKREWYGLASQLRRAAVSIPANFAEGFKKLGRADKLRYYNIAQGSLEECRYYLILSQDLGYADTQQCLTKLEEVSRMLTGYINAVRRNADS